MNAATKTATRPTVSVSYEQDFYTWTQEQGARLRAGELKALDLENLAEEIESLGRSQFDALVSAWHIVILHMLKFDHQPSRRTRSWAISIATHRANAGFELKDSPGLKSRREEALARAYHGARLEASKETRLPLKRFPQTCPYTLDEVLTRPFAIDPDETPDTVLKTRIIPCLDVKDGRVVKGVQFLELRDAGDPVEAAKAYDAAGADELCFLDITASHEDRGTLLDIVSRTAEACFMPLTVGGGIRTVTDIRTLLLAGADKVSINTAAVKDPDFVAAGALKFGSQCIVVAIDAKRTSGPGEAPAWQIFTHGGRNSTGIDAIAFARRMAERGAGELLVTSMDRDGMRSGYDLALTRAITDAVPIPVIASGGVGSLDDFVAGVRDGGASAVLAASIFHFGQHTVREAKLHMAAAGLAMRLDESGVRP